MLVLGTRNIGQKSTECNLQPRRFHIHGDYPLKQMQNKQLANKDKQKPARDHPLHYRFTNGGLAGPSLEFLSLFVISVGENHILSCTIR